MTDEKKKEPVQDQVFDHEFDGIQEYDNRLPNWWLYTLYGSIIFSVIYWFYFHTSSVGALPVERYDREMVAAAEAQLKRMEGQEISNESLTLTSTVPDRVAAGRQVFEQFCVVCHMAGGQGNVGPNLTDRYWLHGGSPLEILNTVNHGVPDKGMVAWAGQLGPRRVQDVVAYILTIKNTDVPGKEPQGVLEGTGAAPDSASTASPAAAEGAATPGN